MAGPYRQTLISASQNINIESFEHRAHGCAVRKRRLHGGRSEGVDLIEIDNGRMTIRVIATRGMGIADVVCDDMRLGWDSPVKEIVHPAFVNLQHRGGLGWLEAFNEWFVRCGLEWFGAPGNESEHLAKAQPPIGALTLHGRIANLPASEVELVINDRPPHRVRLRGLVREQSMFGPCLDLQTELSTTPGSSALRVEDAITNMGGQTQEFGLLYHVNFGKPLLEAGSQFVGAVASVTPINERAAEGDVSGYARYGKPKLGATEQVYLMKLLADRKGMTQVMLRNRAGSRGASMAFSIEQLPCFTLWKNTIAEVDGYVTGLEPGTNYPFPRPIERRMKRVPKLRAGQTHRTAIDVTIHTSQSEVAAAAKQIAQIQGKRETRIDREPPKI